MDSKDFISDEILKQFKTGDELMSFLTSIQKRGIEKILEGEMDSHLGYEKHDKTGAPNSRNGFSNKKIKTSFGEDSIQVPRDRDGSFSPMLVPKRKGMAEGIENIIISLYSRGMSNSDIENQIRDLYNVEVSTSTISRITNAITEDIVAWQNRPLEDVYLIVWLDGIVFKVREQSKVINKTIYIAIGLRQDGIKEVLGLWLGRKESSSFWMSVLTDMKARGVNDILITATDNLNGFTETIKTVFPQSNTQICIVHQIRNACKFVSYKDRKPFTADMKKIYGAPTKQSAEAAFKDFAMTWEDKYPYSVQSWRTNWDELTTFFGFPVEIRKIMYTTNLIENLNGKIRKYTKNKLSFPTDESVMKSVYLAVQEATRKWSMPIHNWGVITNQFIIIFGARLTKYMKA
ncbi:MAG: IS256 family transposase [Saprospiraceae bacterium]|jgi:putative transposase|uniref:IS256 family transposase n=1 Tax=Candidatus Brachybacter algidus TaxID=2982024 RepID=UPI00257C2BBD|nr:IS256 family transposase [Candidatus Brachybacter algidus]MBK7604667.1 IS256 family transposase [Candidatus Brachybacter algidus]